MGFKQIPNLFLIFTLILIGFACSDSSTGSQAETATVKGRVANNEEVNKATSTAHNKTVAVEGAVVTAARITADGSLHTINGSEVKTNAEGEFRLEVNMEAVADDAERVIIIAEKEGQKWKAYISGELEGGSTIKLSPLNVESSGEASVYQALVAGGDTELVTKADIEVFVGAQAAAELQENMEAAAEFAAALSAEAHTRSQFFANQSIEITGQQRNEIEAAKTEALAKFDAKLYASTGETARAEAYDAFLHAMASAYVDAGIDASAYAKAKEMSTRLLIKNATKLSSRAKAGVRTNAAAIAAIAIDNAVQASLKAANARETSIQAAVQAGTQLRSEIKTKAAASKSELNAMFEAYNAAIVDILQQEFAGNAEVMAGINSEINSTGGIKAILEATIAATISTDVIVEAYSTFYTNVKAIVNDQFRTASEIEAELVTDLMILINIAN